MATLKTLNKEWTKKVSFIKCITSKKTKLLHPSILYRRLCCNRHRICYRLRQCKRVYRKAHRCHYAEINAQRIPVRPRFISAKFLVSAPPICKRCFSAAKDAAKDDWQRCFNRQSKTLVGTCTRRYNFHTCTIFICYTTVTAVL